MEPCFGELSLGYGLINARKRIRALSSSTFLAIGILSKSNQIPLDQFACARLFILT